MTCCSSCATSVVCNAPKFTSHEVDMFFDEKLPAMGGSLAPAGTTGKDIADWIWPEHRTICALVLSMSTTWHTSADGYTLITSDSLLKTVRIGVWRNAAGHYVVGCRATGIGAKGAFQDLADDKAVAGFAKGLGICDLNIVREGKAVVQRLLNRYVTDARKITVAGYSLGGTAAICIGTSTPNVQVVSFAGGAPPTNPLLQGPGPYRATHYHVLGDLVSTHVSPKAATVVRVDKGYTEFSVVAPHLSGRFLRRDGPAKPVSADEEDEKMLMWAFGTNKPQQAKSWLSRAIDFITPTILKAGMNVADTAAHAYYSKVACQSPIPGSTRALTHTCAPECGRLGICPVGAGLEDDGSGEGW